MLVEYDFSGLGRDHFPEPGRGGLGRWGELLPVALDDPAYADDVGNSPTVRDAALGRRLGAEVWWKWEGGNPSGSFKDRGLAIGVALARACGAERVGLPTQGNAGVAASLFAARTGGPAALVYMPDGHRGGFYHRAAIRFGAEVRFSGANIADAGRAMRSDHRDELEDGRLVDLSTFFEPGRLEGKKTMGFEIAERFGPEALPEVLLYPTGGGTGLVGIWKAFDELEALGLLGPGLPRPRMVAVQSDRCAPVVAAWDSGASRVEPVVSRGTIADGLDVPGAIMGHRILEVLERSEGRAVAVPEEAIAREGERAGHEGRAIGYESAATIVAAEQLRAEGWIAAGERVLLLWTGGYGPTLGSTPGPAAPTTS